VDLVSQGPGVAGHPGGHGHERHQRVGDLLPAPHEQPAQRPGHGRQDHVVDRPAVGVADGGHVLQRDLQEGEAPMG